MHREEEREQGICVDCGAEIPLRSGSAFTFGATGVLCLECAIRRGGRYDGERDHWDVEPDLRGLAREFD